MARQIGHPLVWLIWSAGLLHLFNGSATEAYTPAPVRTRTYRFTARITDNAGITLLKVGELIKGTFTYDLDGENLRPEGARLSRYHSKRNSLVFQHGDQQFSGVGNISASVSVYDFAEHFGVVAPDLKLPNGWEMDHTRRSQAYGILLQNAPPRKVHHSTQLPHQLSLAEYVDTRELRLDFFHGVRFPGGQVKGRATVYATVETLEEDSPR